MANLFHLCIPSGWLLGPADAQTAKTIHLGRARYFYLRALIDKEMFAHKGRMEGAELKGAFEELTRIYHAENTHSMPVKPPQVK